MCAEQLKDYIARLPEKELQERRIYVSLEFTYFWMHVTNRMAYDEIGNENRIKLQRELGLSVIEPIVETLFNHWPENMRQNILLEIFDKLNEAEMEYSNVQNLLPEGDLYKDESIFSRLAMNVAQLFDQAQDSELITTILNHTINTFSEIDLKNLINAAAMELKD
ncbi:MAG: hypothetical protein IIB40_08720 [Candidatus Marinimicrobia bacterium]|nr:hypothetical protein [Candidatus Neomarinimicrobiota bacterium]